MEHDTTQGEFDDLELNSANDRHGHAMAMTIDIFSRLQPHLNINMHRHYRYSFKSELSDDKWPL